MLEYLNELQTSIWDNRRQSTKLRSSQAHLLVSSFVCVCALSFPGGVSRLHCVGVFIGKVCAFCICSFCIFHWEAAGSQRLPYPSSLLWPDSEPGHKNRSLSLKNKGGNSIDIPGSITIQMNLRRDTFHGLKTLSLFIFNSGLFRCKKVHYQTLNVIVKVTWRSFTGGKKKNPPKQTGELGWFLIYQAFFDLESSQPFIWRQSQVNKF